MKIKGAGHALLAGHDKDDCKDCVIAALADALEQMVKAHAALMPGLRHIAVQDYALQNDAPIAAHAALRKVGRDVK